jgi:hypothetical protein
MFILFIHDPDKVLFPIMKTFGSSRAWPCSHGAFARRQWRLLFPYVGHARRWRPRPRPATVAAEPRPYGGGGLADAAGYFRFWFREESPSRAWQPRRHLLLCLHRRGRGIHIKTPIRLIRRKLQPCNPRSPCVHTREVERNLGLCLGACAHRKKNQ